MKARVVIGANFGDEGKGLLTDYLCHQGAGMVVRFNGGGQAGHTVVTPQGPRHVFHHVGSGAFCNVPTFLSQFFVLNPIVLFKELDDLKKLNVHPVVYAHPNCVVTTFADMIINQRKEEARGVKRHGSVGVGVHETMQRSQTNLNITMSDLWNGIDIKDRLKEICTKWAKYRSGSHIDKHEAMIEAFVHGCERFAEYVNPLGIGQCKDPVFEGAQGLLLSQDNEAMRPHLTHSYTGMRNVRILCEQAGIKDIEPWYVSRTYMTRHGAGPMPGENPGMAFADDTNLPHDFQGTLRFGALDHSALRQRCVADAGTLNYKLLLTHCDQLHTGTADRYSYGPTRDDIRNIPVQHP